MARTEERATRYLTVVGMLEPDHRLTLEPGYLTDEPEGSVEDRSSPLVAELADDEGRVLLRFHLPVAEFCAYGSSETVLGLAITAKLPFPPRTRTIRFLHEEASVHEIEVSRTAPEIAWEWRPPDGTVEGRHTVSWQGSHPEGLDLRYVLRYSHDGRTWRPLGLTSPDTSLEVDFDGLPGGDACRLQVLATDGVNTTALDGEPFRVAIKGVVAMILSPADGATVGSAEPLWFQGQGYHLEEDRPELEDLAWVSSIDGDLGTGPHFERVLSPGRHAITLTAGAEEPRRSSTVTLEVA